MSGRITQPQGQMLGTTRRDARSKTSRSGKCVDRQRRSAKRSDKEQLREDIKAGKYSNFLKA